MKSPGEIELVDGPCPKCGRPLHRIGSFEDLGELVKSGGNIKFSVNLMIMKVIG